MKLEIISKYPPEQRHTTPLLFVHGAWHGAWCWENFLPYFAEQGYEAHALSLRGHGNSEGRDRLRWHSTAGYVADVRRVANGLSTHPILVGHSMGGYVVQKYLEQYVAPAGVLLASIPTVGILGMLFRMLRRHPVSTLKALLLLNPWYFVSTPSLAKYYFFSDDFPDEKFLHYYQYIQSESFRMALESALLRLPRPGKVKTPLLVLGAQNDRVFTVREQKRTARAYQTEAILYPGMAHDMMLEHDWKTVADKILSWLNTRQL